MKAKCKERGQQYFELRGVHPKVLKNIGARNVDMPGMQKISAPVGQLLLAHRLHGEIMPIKCLGDVANN